MTVVLAPDVTKLWCLLFAKRFSDKHIISKQSDCQEQSHWDKNKHRSDVYHSNVTWETVVGREDGGEQMERWVDMGVRGRPTGTKLAFIYHTLPRTPSPGAIPMMGGAPLPGAMPGPASLSLLNKRLFHHPLVSQDIFHIHYSRCREFPMSIRKTGDWLC